MSKFKRHIAIALVVLSCAIISSEAIICIKCNSDQDLECVASATTLKDICEGDACYTFIEKQSTIRRCTPPEGGCSGDLCKSCDTDKCNTETFPSDRPTCIQCKGKDGCVSAESLKGTQCRNYEKDASCFTYVESLDNTVRGCTSDKFDNCKADNCVTCSGNNCNTVAATAPYSCIQCNSTKECQKSTGTSDDCKIPNSGGQCPEPALLGRKKECFTYLRGDSVERGCGNKTPSLVNGDKFDVCDGENCNFKCVDDASCYTCDSEKNAECSDPSKLEGFKQNCTEYTTRCNQCETLDGKRLVRSCGGTPADDMVCEPCRDALCNKGTLQKSCYYCDSKTNPQCARNIDIGTKFCKTKDDECYVMINADGDTVRGCKSEMPQAGCSENDANCKTCKTHNCNTDVLVDDPIRCYTCKGDGCDGNQDIKNGTDCAKVDDVCYMYSPDNKTMQRGCMSESGHPEACDKNDPTCVKCNTNDCNGRALDGPSGLKCVQCKSDSVPCQWSFVPEAAQACENKVLYYQRDLCYTLANAKGDVERGCLTGTQECKLEDLKCRICYDDGCNTESSKKFNCVRCRSDNEGEESCKKESPKFVSSCRNVPTFEQLGCYVANWDGVIVRGCLSDLDNVDYINCMNDRKLCRHCTTENCNDGKAPNGSTAIISSISLIVGSLYILIVHFI